VWLATDTLNDGTECVWDEISCWWLPMLCEWLPLLLVVALPLKECVWEPME